MRKFLSYRIVSCILTGTFLVFMLGNVAFGASGKGFKVLSQSATDLVLSFTVEQYQLEEVTTPSGIAYTIKESNSSPLLTAGAPDLRKLTASYILPDMGAASVEILSSTFTEQTDILIAPSKGNLYRNQNPSKVPFVYGESYQTDAFYPGELTHLNSPYILRDFRGQTIWVYPFQYNPVLKTLRIYQEIIVKISFEGNNPTNTFSRTTQSNIAPLFDEIYENHFANYTTPPTVASTVDEALDGRMLIISHSSFSADMQDFIDWKIQKGMETELVDLSVTGSTSADIQAYISAYYTTYPDLMYVVLVGDAQYVPSPFKSGGDSDPSYGYLTGTDSYAEVFVGRISAESSADVLTQVERILNYEKLAVTNTDYSKALHIASNQGPGDDNELDYEHQRNLRTLLIAAGYTVGDEFYDGTNGGQDAAGDPTPSMVNTSVNDGKGTIMYTGHGSAVSWGSSGYSNSDITGLTNTGMLPFIWSVACVNGAFNGTTCFAEAWMRATYNNLPVGAISTFMSSINQSWNPPMEAQDEIVNIMTGNTSGVSRVTFGGLSINGCYSMNDVYGTSGDEMTDTWHIFGDPSLLVRTMIVADLTATHTSGTPIGTTSLQISCPVDGALICLSMGNAIIAKGFVSGGMVNLSFSSLNTVGTLSVTGTAFNYKPYIGTISVVPASGPYITYNSSMVQDPTGNNNNLPDYGEAVLLDVTLENVGINTSNGVTATLSSASTYVTITDNIEAFGNVNASTTASVASAYAFQVASNVPDGTSVLFTLTITDQLSNSWSANFTLTLNAPELASGTVSVTDPSGNGNQIMDPNETVVLSLQALNNGHAGTANAVATLSANHPGVTVTNPSIALGAIAINGFLPADFTVAIDWSVPTGTLVDFTYTVTEGAYTWQQVYTFEIGMMLENFETTDFNLYPWTNTATFPWIIDSTGAYDGSACATSFDINDDEASSIEITMNVAANDSIVFFKKLDSEQYYDFLEFYMDNQLLDSWSGNINWTRHMYPVTAGTHTFKWNYFKDYIVSSGADAAWLDYIRFPLDQTTTGLNTQSITTNQFTIFPNPAGKEVHFFCSLAQSSSMNILVMNISGQVIAEPVVKTTLNAGTHEFTWQNNLPAGTYLCRFISGNEVKYTKLIIAE